MYNIKKRVIDLDIEMIITAPVNKTTSNKRFLCCFKALVRYPISKTSFKEHLGASMILDITAPPYTQYLFYAIYKKYKNNIYTRLDFLKVWGYPYKPNRDNVGFYCLEATERIPNKEIIGDNNQPFTCDNLSLMFNSHFIGIEYLKEKYPELRSKDRGNDYNILTNYFLTKHSGKNSTLYYPRDYSQLINVVMFNNLYKITNPDNLEELKDKPLFFQIVGHLTDIIHKEHPTEDIISIRKYVLSNNSYKALKPKNTKAQK